MKLFYQTGLALLLCSLGGLAFAIGMSRGYSEIESSTLELGPNSVALRDVDHFEASMNQWFITIDLVFGDGQTYLAEGVGEQAADLNQVLKDLAQTTLAHDARAELDAARQQIDTIAECINRSALWSASQRDANLGEVIETSDSAATALIDGVEQIKAVLHERSKQAVAALDTQRARFKTTVGVLGVVYVLLVGLVWRWTTVGIVRPVVRLTQAAGQAALSVEGFAITESGPKEIRQLTRDIRSFVTKLDSQRVQAGESARRVQAVMDAAPDAIVTINPAGKIATFNAAALILFGLTSDDLEGHDAQALLPDYLVFLRGEAGMAGVAAEIKAFRGSGEPFPADLSMSEVGLEGSTHYTAVLRDITNRKAREQEVKKLNQQLVDTSRQAGMAEIASGVLHNVGNVLTSVNVTATSLSDRIRGSKVTGLTRAVEMMNAHADDLPRFIEHDPKGQKLPAFITKLSELLGQEQESLQEGVGGLIKSIDHIKEVVASQQSVARVQNVDEAMAVSELLDDAVEVNRLRLEKFGVTIDKQLEALPPVRVDRHKTMQILVNLVKNACDAMERNTPETRRMTLKAQQLEDGMVRLSVADAGSGIAPENLARVFNHGFTTKADGHGFGLHSSANTAQQMGGRLTAASDGVGHGACFQLDLPLTTEPSGHKDTPCKTL